MTSSDERLRKAMRRFQSKAFEGGTSYIGSNLPLDEQVNSVMLGIVDVFFHEDLQLRFYHRDTLVDDGRPAKTGYAYLVMDTPLKTEEIQNWMSNIPGPVTVDKKTGKPCIIPDNDYICSVEAIKGDPSIDTVAFVCLGFLLMRGEEFEGREVEPYVTGSDVEAAINTAGAALINMIVPVGTIITSADGTNPGERIPGTTWVPEAEGKFILGVGGGYANGATGGSATVTLGVNNLPSHNHNVTIVSSGASTSGPPSTNSTDFSGGDTTGGSGALTADSNGGHNHDLKYSNDATVGGSSARTRAGATGGTTNTESVAGHTHNIPSHTHTTPNHSHTLSNHTHAVQNHTHTVSEDNIGSAAPVSIMPPYIARYKWRRTV